MIYNKYQELKNVRKLQYFAGLKWTSSAERYINVNDDELMEVIEEFHRYRMLNNG